MKMYCYLQIMKLRYLDILFDCELNYLLDEMCCKVLKTVYSAFVRLIFEYEPLKQIN